MYKPLVSIVIPVYKGKPFLKEAINSCLAQTYKNIEIIVVNDGSPDKGETREIAQSYGDKIRYFEKENGGVSTALNFGISQMKGEWFSWLSHDDLYEPTKIEAQIEAVSNLEEKTCVVRCSTISINEFGTSIFRPQRKISGVFSGLEMLRLHSLKEVGLYGCSLLINKRIIDSIGMFSEDLKTVQDEEYWTKIMLKGYKFVSVPEPLVKIRIHSGQTTNLLNDRFQVERRIFIKRFIDVYNTNQDYYFDGMMILLYKQIQSQRNDLIKMLKPILIQNRKFNFTKSLNCTLYFLYGKVYSLIKKLYRQLIIRKNRTVNV